MIPYSHTIRIKRTKEGEYVRGKRQDGTSEFFDMKANVQPYNPTRVVREAQGERQTGMVKVYSKEKIFVASEEGVEADRFKFRGKIYEAQESHDMNFSSFSCSHYKTICVLMNQEDFGENDDL